MASFELADLLTTKGGLRALLDGMPEPILLLDKTETVVAANASAETLFGRALAGVALMRVIRWPEALSAASQAIENGESVEAICRTNDSVQITYRIVASPIAINTAETGPVAILSLRDVSHIEEAERMRRDFVANVSHELRSPLTALTGFIETLKGPAKDDPKAQERFLDIMENEAARMDRLIDDILSLSKIEVDRHVRPRATVDLTRVIKDVRDSLSQYAKQIKADIEYLPSPGPVEVLGEYDQLVQVLRNLIENALKYAGHGKITVKQSVMDSALGFAGPAVKIDVIDEGPGIAAEHIPRLTQRFYRVDIGRSRDAGGTGLGLAIVKHIISRHRGRLNIESTIGKGSVFSVILPLKQVET